MCYEWEELQCTIYFLVVAANLLVVPDCTAVLSLVAIVGHVGLCNGVSSSRPMCAQGSCSRIGLCANITHARFTARLEDIDMRTYSDNSRRSSITLKIISTGWGRTACRKFPFPWLLLSWSNVNMCCLEILLYFHNVVAILACVFVPQGSKIGWVHHGYHLGDKCSFNFLAQMECLIRHLPYLVCCSDLGFSTFLGRIEWTRVGWGLE